VKALIKIVKNAPSPVIVAAIKNHITLLQGQVTPLEQISEIVTESNRGKRIAL